MIDKFEYKGLWYLPSDPNNTVAGILTYTPNESIILELIGSLGEAETDIISFSKRTTVEIIWGITSDAKKISLIKCAPSGGYLNLNCSFPISKYLIHYCLDGLHIESFEDKRFSWSNITIPALTTWCFPDALNLICGFNEKDRINKINISFNGDDIKEPLISVNIRSTTTLNIKKNVQFDESKYRLNPTFSQSTFLQIQKTCKSSISDFLSDIFLFENFISLAALYTTKVSNISLYDETNYQEIESKEKIILPIELIYVQRGAESKINQEYDFLFSYSQIQDIYPYIIKKWYNETSKIAPIRAHLIQSVKAKSTFESTDFLIVIQAIEGFCLRFREEQFYVRFKKEKGREPSLAEILKNILNEFNDIEKLKQSDINIKATVDSRHYYSHFMNKTKKPSTLDGSKLFHLTQQLRILLICCLLSFIGINNQRINHLLNKSYNTKLQ
jgi:hypothetical protein